MSTRTPRTVSLFGMLPTACGNLTREEPQSQESCHFCLNNVKDTDLYSVTTPCCQHMVHCACFQRWIRSQRPARCAYCRAPYREESFCFICLKELNHERLKRTNCCHALIHADCLILLQKKLYDLFRFA